MHRLALLVLVSMSFGCGSGADAPSSGADPSAGADSATTGDGAGASDSGVVADAVDAHAEAAVPDAVIPDTGAVHADASPPGDASPAADAAPDAAAAGLTIPIAVDRSSGRPFVTTQVSVGGSPPFTVIVDTGSVGLRVLGGVVPDGAWTVGTDPVQTTYGGAVVVQGVVATGVITVGSISTPEPIPMMAITDVSCTADKPTCPAAGKDATTFRFMGTYGAILGIGTRSGAPAKMWSPLASMGKTQRYVFSLGALDSGGSLILDPTDTTRFTTTIALTALPTAASPTIPAWDDFHVPLCANSFCVEGILDSGSPAILLTASTPDDFVALGVPDGSTTVPAGTAVTLTIGTTASWSVTVGDPAEAGKDRFVLGAGSNNFGLAPYHQFDVLYDYAKGTIGLAKL